MFLLLHIERLRTIYAPTYIRALYGQNKRPSCVQCVPVSKSTRLARYGHRSPSPNEDNEEEMPPTAVRSSPVT